MDTSFTLPSFFFFQFLLRYSKLHLQLHCFTMLYQFVMYCKVNRLYICIHIYSLFFGFPFHLGHHRAVNRVPCAIQQVLISYLFSTQQCVYANSNLLFYATPLPPTSPPPVSTHLSCMSVSLFLLCKQVHLHHFSRFHIYALIYSICFSYFYLTSLCKLLCLYEYQRITSLLISHLACKKLRSHHYTTRNFVFSYKTTLTLIK